MTEHSANVRRDIQKMIAVADRSPTERQRRCMSDAFCIVAQQQIADSMNV